MDRKKIVLLYVINRLHDDVPELLKLLSDNCTLISRDGISHTGKTNLQEYLSIPQSKNLIIGKVEYDDLEYNVDLTFSVFNTTRLYFTFDEKDKICKIRVKDLSLTGEFIKRRKSFFY